MRLGRTTAPPWRGCFNAQATPVGKSLLVFEKASVYRTLGVADYAAVVRTLKQPRQGGAAVRLSFHTSSKGRGPRHSNTQGRVKLGCGIPAAEALALERFRARFVAVRLGDGHNTLRRQSTERRFLSTSWTGRLQIGQRTRLIWTREKLPNPRAYRSTWRPLGKR
jgi:hypothetical protein